MTDEAKTYPESLLQQAQVMSDLGDRDPHVVELLSVYTKLRPDHGFAWFLLGDALRHVGRLKEAEEALMNALELAPKNSRFAIYARIGMLMRRRRGPAEAEKWYRLATAEPDCPGWMWCARGANLVDMESFRLAKSCLESALASEDVDKDEVFLNLGLAARAERHYGEARGYLQRALEIDPNYAEAKRVLESIEQIEDTVKQAAQA